MKRLTSTLMALGMVIMSAAAYAAPVATVTMQAQVVPQLDLTMWIMEADKDETNPGENGTEVTSMNFSQLEEVVNAGTGEAYGIYGGSKYYAVYLYAKTSARPYKITQTAQGFGDIGKALVMTPQYYKTDKLIYEVNGVPHEKLNSSVAGDTNNDPDTGTLGRAGNAIGTRDIYTSNAGNGDGFIIRCDYGLFTADPNTPAALKPENMDADDLLIIDETASGVYVGTVTFTLTLN